MSNRLPADAVRAGLGAAAVLLLPLGATLAGVASWGPFDFAVAWALLASAGMAGLSLSRALRRRPPLRALALAAVTLAVLLAWAELAVGVLGSPLAGS